MISALTAPIRWLLGIIEWERPGSLGKVGGPVALTVGTAAALTWGALSVLGPLAPPAGVPIYVPTSSPSPDTVLWREEFDDTALISRGWYDQFSSFSGMLDTDTTFRGAGSFSLEWQSSAQSVQFGVGLRRLLGDTVQTVGVQWRTKFMDGWQGSGETFNPHMILLVTDEDGEFVSTAHNQSTFYVEHNYVSGSGVRGALRAGDNANIDTVSYGGDEGGNWPWPDTFVDSTETRSTHGCNGVGDAYDIASGEASCFNSPPWRNYRDFEADSGLIADGSLDWHLVEAEVALNTVSGGIGQADGRMRMWIDSVLVLDRPNMLMRTGQHPDMGINQLVLGPYMANGSPATQNLWIDDLAVCAGGRCPAPPEGDAAEGGTVTNQALSFPGTQDSLQGRARIQIATSGTDPSRHTLNVGNTDFSVEFGIRFDDADVAETMAGDSNCDTSGSYAFVNTDIFYDNDRFEGQGAPSSEPGFGAGVFLDTDNSSNARIMWSMRQPSGSPEDYTICSDAATNLGDDAWHHVLIQWEESSGQMAIYVDGTREGYTATSQITGDVSLGLSTSYTGQNPYLVLGNEKHNISGQEPFTGDMDELRISTILQQPSWPASYTAPTAALEVDSATVGLFHMDETVESDSLENQTPIRDDPGTWTNKFAILTGVSFITSTASTDAVPNVRAFSDWEGASDWSDNGKWIELNTVGDVTVESNPGDFPAGLSNIIEHGTNNGFSNFRFNDDDDGNLALGACVTWRWIWEMADVESWDDSGNHGIVWNNIDDPAPIGNGLEPWLDFTPGASGWTVAYVDSLSGPTPEPERWNGNATLSYDTPYMFVLQICADATDNSRWWPYVYSVDGQTLIMGPWDFQAVFVTSDLMSDDMWTMDRPMKDAREFARYFTGWSSGMSGGTPTSSYFQRAGALLVVDGRWTGPYLLYPITGEGS